jgi:hypothetical protein
MYKKTHIELQTFPTPYAPASCLAICYLSLSLFIPAILLGRVNLLPSVWLFIQYGIFHLNYPFRFSSSDCGIGGRTLLSLK